PYFGPIIGAIPALLLAAFQSPSMLIQVGILYLVVQQLDGFVITPRIVGGRIGLHPLWVIFGVMAGGVLFGLWGLFLGVPATALIKVCVNHLTSWIYMQPDRV
ncbi:MAG: AI-2E family transporter, partial [Bacillota bacterium]